MATENEQTDAETARREVAKAEVDAEFDRYLAPLRAPDVRQRVEAVMAARGRGKRRPKAGLTF
jgi:hypothetical protein